MRTQYDNTVPTVLSRDARARLPLRTDDLIVHSQHVAHRVEYIHAVRRCACYTATCKQQDSRGDRTLNGGERRKGASEAS